jgi:hypothetical protein
MASMDSNDAPTNARRAPLGLNRLVDWTDPALWAWAVVVVMLAVPAAVTLV